MNFQRDENSEKQSVQRKNREIEAFILPGNMESAGLRQKTLPGLVDDQQNYLKQFQDLVKRWDEAKNDPAHFDATEVLTKMADILEKVLCFTI